MIGAGHLPGMSKQLEAGDIRDPDNTIAALDIIPASSPWLKIIPWSIVALIFVGFGIGFSRSPEMGTSMIIEWIVINGGLSALGAAIAALRCQPPAQRACLPGDSVGAPAVHFDCFCGGANNVFESYHRCRNGGCSR